MRIKTGAILCFLFLSVNTLANNAAAAKQTVKSFYQFHLSRDTVFSKTEIDRRKRFFTNQFYNLLLGEWERDFEYRKADSNMKPAFDSLPFEPGEEACPHPHRLGKALVKNERAKVEVKFFHSQKCGGKFIAKYTIELIKFKDKWLIDDVIYEDGERLSAGLKRLKAIKN